MRVWIVEYLNDDIPDHFIEEVFRFESTAITWVNAQEEPEQYTITEMEVK